MVKQWHEETIDQIIERCDRRDILVKLKQLFEDHNESIDDLPRGLETPYTCPIIDEANSTIDQIIESAKRIDDDPDEVSSILDDCATLIEEHEQVRQCNAELRSEADSMLGSLDLDQLDTSILEELEATW